MKEVHLRLNYTCKLLRYCIVKKNKTINDIIDRQECANKIVKQSEFLTQKTQITHVELCFAHYFYVLIFNIYI